MSQHDPDGERIEPVAFRSLGGYRSYRNKKLIRVTAGVAAALVLILLCGGAWFVFTARQVLIQISPLPEMMNIKGGIAAPRVGEYFLMRPGEYELVARKACYRDLNHHFKVGTAKNQQIRLAMEKRPGKLEVNAHQVDRPEQTIAGAIIHMDGDRIGRTPLPAFEIDAGEHRLEIAAQNYKTQAQDILIEGCGQLQKLDLALVPGWSNLTISSAPPGATVSIDGKKVGKTPIQLDLTEGAYELSLGAAGYKTWRRKIDMTANQPLKLEDIELKPADGRLTITTVPAGAMVKIGNRPAGRTPLTTEIAPDEKHAIAISKPGYASTQRSVQLRSEESKTLKITLEPQTGTLRLQVDPPGAEIWIDGVKRELSDQPLTLTAVEHQLEIRKEGFVTHRRKILPRPDALTDLIIVLEPVASTRQSIANRITAPNGYPLRLVNPGAFTMGSSRREQGRRSNETIRAVTLTRPFYIGTREVTNGEFRQFQASHRSGEHKGQSLDGDGLPVVSVSWEQAALFCNWLSARASLPPVYVTQNGRLTAAGRIGAGYRLPTEAEWAYAARMSGAPAAPGIKFPWGKGYPPPEGAGNFADASAKDILASYMESYNDGYPLTAPPGKFKANRMGLLDLSGNVAEWCHDYYRIYQPGQKFVDPAGPDEGRHHVVRGSSWKHGSISTLRVAYRDYSDSKRTDLGFRVARYVK